MGERQSGGVVQKEKKRQVPADKVCGTADAGASTVDLPCVPTVSALLSLDPTGGPSAWLSQGFPNTSLSSLSTQSSYLVQERLRLSSRGHCQVEGGVKVRRGPFPSLLLSGLLRSRWNPL